MSSVIARHDPRQVLSVCYSNRDTEDGLTDWIKANPAEAQKLAREWKPKR